MAYPDKFKTSAYHDFWGDSEIDMPYFELLCKEAKKALANAFLETSYNIRQVIMIEALNKVERFANRYLKISSKFDGQQLMRYSGLFAAIATDERGFAEDELTDYLIAYNHALIDVIEG